MAGLNRYWNGTQWLDLQGAPGATGLTGLTGLTGPPGPSAVSADAGNMAKLGSDSLIYVDAHRIHALTRGNVLVNGDFSVWQRGNGFSAAQIPLTFPVGQNYTADGWQVQTLGVAALPTMGQSGFGGLQAFGQCRLQQTMSHTDQPMADYSPFTLFLHGVGPGFTALAIDAVYLTLTWKKGAAPVRTKLLTGIAKPSKVKDALRFVFPAIRPFGGPAPTWGDGTVWEAPALYNASEFTWTLSIHMKASDANSIINGAFLCDGDVDLDTMPKEDRVTNLARCQRRYYRDKPGVVPINMTTANGGYFSWPIAQVMRSFDSTFRHSIKRFVSYTSSALLLPDDLGLAYFTFGIAVPGGIAVAVGIGGGPKVHVSTKSGTVFTMLLRDWDTQNAFSGSSGVLQHGVNVFYEIEAEPR